MSEKASILIVDDQPENLLILEDQLSNLYSLHAANNGQEAVDYLQSHPETDLVLLDVMMPVMDGFKACEVMKASPVLKDIPVLFLTSLESAADEEYALSLGAVDFIHKPFSAPVVLARVRNHLQLAMARRYLRRRNQDLEHLVGEQTEMYIEQSQELSKSRNQLVATQSATISAFCSLAETRDNETGNHIFRTQNYMFCLAEKLKNHPRFSAHLSEDSIYLICKSAPLHDIGKVAIPDSILLKEGPLNEEEWIVMRKHSEYGRNAIMRAMHEMGGESDSFLRYALDIAYCHHEKWDGSGYPQGLKGEDIPLAARLMALADVYDALVSKRVYKPAFSHEKALQIIEESSGTHFDPDIAVAMIEIQHELNEIAIRYSDKE